MGFDYIEQVLIENIESKFQASSLPASKLFSGGTVFSNYYNIDKVNTTFAEGFNDVNEYIGLESPVRYNLYSKMPLLGFQNFGGTELTYNEQEGFNLPRTSSAYISPDIIRPIEGDVFTLVHENNSFLYIVNSVSIANVQNKPYHRITFSSLETDVVSSFFILNDHQTLERYTVFYDNLGKGNISPVLKSENLQTVVDLNKLTTELNDTYMDFFYNKRFKNMVYINGDDKYYDVNLVQFLRNRPILNFQGNDLILPVEALTIRQFQAGYLKSFYHSIENKISPDLASRTFHVNNFDRYYNYNLLNGLCGLKLIEKRFDSHPMDEFIVIPYNPTTNVFDDLIEKWCTDTLTISVVTNMMTILTNIDIENTLEHYMKIPICLYIIKNIINNVFLSKELVKSNDYLKSI